MQYIDKGVDDSGYTTTETSKSNASFKKLTSKPGTEAIPKWESTEDGQRLHIPSSDDDTIIAKLKLSNFLCCYAPFGEGDYILDWKDNTRISTMISKEEVELYCSRASEYCKQSFDYAASGRKVFYCGMAFTIMICSLIIGVAVKFEIPWLSGLAVIVFLFAIGCFYEVINSRARRIYETLKGFIEINEDYTRKGIEVRAGANGAYIEFGILTQKVIS